MLQLVAASEVELHSRGNRGEEGRRGKVGGGELCVGVWD